MPADSITQIYDFEGQIEPPFAALLESFLTIGGKTVQESRGAGELTTPRIEVVLQMGPQETHLFPWKGNLMPDAYKAVIVCSVVTERDMNVEVANKLRAQVRAFMFARLTKDPAVRQLTISTIPFHTVSRLTEAGTQNLVDDKNNLDYSRVSFNAKIAIRHDAWPA